MVSEGSGRVACKSCTVPTMVHLLFDGSCTECLGDQSRSGHDMVLEEYVRSDGQRMAAKVPRNRGAAMRREGPRFNAGRFGPFSTHDALDLERYFNSKAAEAAAALERSPMGAMMDHGRESQASVATSKRTPTEGRCPICDKLLVWHRDSALWAKTKCRHQTESGRLSTVETPSHLPSHELQLKPCHVDTPTTGEDELMRIVDLRRSLTLVTSVLNQLPGRLYAILEARYTVSQERAAAVDKSAERAHMSLGVLATVATRTKAVRDWRIRQAKSGSTMLSLRESLYELTSRATMGGAGPEDRAIAMAALSSAKREAASLVREAESAYAMVRNASV